MAGKHWHIASSVGAWSISRYDNPKDHAVRVNSTRTACGRVTSGPISADADLLDFDARSVHACIRCAKIVSLARASHKEVTSR